MAGVILKGISKYYGKHKVIDKLDLSIMDGEFVTLLGPSGCGKTTLLRMIAGLETINDGELYIGNKLSNAIPAQKRHLAMVFQSYALFPHMNVKNNILFGLKIQKMTKHDMFDKLHWVLALLGLDGLEARLPKEISGGQRQRVALARALVLDPEVLLLDEPLSNLDAALRETAMEELKRIHQQLGKTIIYVTHNQAEAMTLSERIAVFHRGAIDQFDTPRLLYDVPRTVFSAEFIGSPASNSYNGTISRKQESVIINTDIGRIFLDRDRAHVIDQSDGVCVYVCIRPQDIHLMNDHVPKRMSDTRMVLSVEMVETMGDRSLVVARGKNDIIVRFLISRDDNILVNDTVNVVVDGRRVHVFDVETRKNIFINKGVYV